MSKALFLVAMLILGIAKGITPPEYRDQMAIWVLILAIRLSDWVQFARVVRGATLVKKIKNIPKQRGWLDAHLLRL